MMNCNYCFSYILMLLTIITFTINGQSLSREKRFIAFPSGSAMGLFLAVAVPIDLPRKNVFVAYNFEANYILPTNESIEETLNLYTVEAGTSEARSQTGFNRTTAYKILEKKIQSHGYPGRECLLRTICELSASSIIHNGVIGEILHVIFSPSTSADEKLPEEYNQAEIDGKNYGICEKYNALCKISFLDLVSWIENLA